MNYFLPLNRKIMKHWLWEDKPFSKGQAWIDLLMLANYTEKKKPVNREIIMYKRGNVNLSMKQLADRWGWDRRTVKRFLDLLSNDDMVSVNSTTHGTTITIINYDVFNDSCTTNGTTDSTTNAHQNVQPNQQPMEQQDVQPIVQQMPTTNKDNNVKELQEDKESKKGKKDKIDIEKRFIPPTVEQVEQYCLERNNTVDAQKFVDFYESKGWFVGKNKMKDWKAAVRTWENTEKKKKQNNTVSYAGNSRDEQFQKLMEQIRRDEENANRGR
ncbi:MAG: hypothetical protein NC548_54180 [Lachnospiraceae bacterium]|nr:hypothetical protein [Lachnospiraceae bacterium]